MRKKTLEEASQNYVNSTVNRFHVEQIAFIAGAKWQKEKSYSEEEVLNLIFKFTSDFDLKKGIEISIEEQKEWFKQFKNK